MKLIYLEMKKSWLKPVTILIVLILTVINIYKIHTSFLYESMDFIEDESLIRINNFKLYNKLKGKITTEKINFIKENYNKLSREVENFNFSKEYDSSRYTGYVFGDYGLFKSFKEGYSHSIMYTNLTRDILIKSLDNVKFYNKFSNIYEVRKNKLYIKRYSNRKLNSYYLTQGIESYFYYDFSSLLILILIIIFFSQSYTKESYSRMNIILYTTQKGRHIAIAKYMSMVLFCLIISLYFMFIDLLTINYLIKIDGMFQPIYYLNNFSFTPYNCSIFLMIVYTYIIKCIAYICFSCIVLFISYSTNNAILSTTLSAFSLSILVYVEKICPSIINPISLLTTRKYICKFNLINILQYPVNSIIIASIFAIFLSLSIVLILVRRKKYV